MYKFGLYLTKREGSLVERALSYLKPDIDTESINFSVLVLKVQEVFVSILDTKECTRKYALKKAILVVTDGKDDMLLTSLLAGGLASRLEAKIESLQLLKQLGIV